MKNLFNKNGLIFWNEEEIELRNMFVKYLRNCINDNLKRLNNAFEFIQVDTPLLIPESFLNTNYSGEDVYFLDEVNGGDLMLRPETTIGSYLAALDLLNTHNERKIRLPFCVWQHGKSFRREQDQELKHMRLKEFYQLEFQILYAASTVNDYSKILIPRVCRAISHLIGKECFIAPSDRLPNYSEETIDIIDKKSNLELCSISKRKDFEKAKNLEIAVGTDRLIYAFQNSDEEAYHQKGVIKQGPTVAEVMREIQTI